MMKKHFFRLNILSIAFAIIITICVELIMNEAWIEAVTGYNLGMIIFMVIVAILIAGAFIFPRKIHIFFERDKIRYFSCILWIPYMVLLEVACQKMFSATMPELTGNGAGAVGILVILLLIPYPFYIWILNYAGNLWNQ